jgi:hypothetical protein
VVGVGPAKVLPVTADKQDRTINVCNHKRLFRLRLRPSFSKAMAEAFLRGYLSHLRPRPPSLLPGKKRR